MDWLWPAYERYVRRGIGDFAAECDDQPRLHTAFMSTLARSSVTLYVMVPEGTAIRFKGLGRWPLPEVPGFIADPHDYISGRFGGGKFKVNFHDGEAFVATHNFRTHGTPLWEDIADLGMFMETGSPDAEP